MKSHGTFVHRFLRSFDSVWVKPRVSPPDFLSVVLSLDFIDSIFSRNMAEIFFTLVIYLFINFTIKKNIFLLLQFILQTSITLYVLISIDVD